MGLRLSVYAVSCLALVGSVAVSMGAAGSERFLVAVVRDDGKVHPFGMLDGDKWKRAWVPVAKTAEVPIRLADIPSRWLGGVPFSATWRLYPDTGPPRDITIERLSWAPSFCQQQVLLDSRDGARQELRPPIGQHVPKQGLATLGGGQISRPSPHGLASPVVAQLSDALGAHIDREEEWALKGVYQGRFVHPYPPKERRTYPVEVINVYEGPGPNGAVAYFEALRRYPRESTDPDLAWCDIVTFAAGWTHTRGGSEFAVSVTDFAITSCTLDSVSRRRLPLGIIHVGSVPQWAFEEYLPQGEQVAVYVPPGRRNEQFVFGTPTGHCMN